MRTQRFAMVLALVGLVATACGGNEDTGGADGSEPPADVAESTSEPADGEAAAPTGEGEFAVNFTPDEERALLDQHEDWDAGAGEDWESLLEAARAEGKVVLASGPNPDFRRLVTEEFERDTGIAIDYLPNAVPAEITGRLRAEAEGGNISVDVFLSGWPGVVDDLPAGLLRPLASELILPTVNDPSGWKNGGQLWQDADATHLLRVLLYVTGYPTINTDHVDPEAIQSWDDLLKPEFSGKIAQFDPRSPGPGSPAGVYMAIEKGEEWFRQYYEQQEPVFTRDQRQLVDWVAQGTYPVGLALDVSQSQELRAAGFPLQPIFPPDAPGVLTSGFGILRLFADSPNPNAATVFANWLASPKGAMVMQLGFDQPALRADVEVTANIPEEIVPQDGVDYVDQNTEAYVKEKMLPGHQIIVGVTGQ